MRLFSNAAVLTLGLLSSTVGAWLLAAPAEADQRNLLFLLESLDSSPAGTAGETLLADADDAPDALIEEDLPPAQLQPGTADGFVDQTIIEPVPAQIPPLVETEFGSSLSISIAPLEAAIVAADGRSTIRLGGRITDASGAPVSEDVVVTLTASAGEFVGADYDIDQAGFQVLARLGEFEAALKSSLESQQVTVRASADPEEVLGPAADETPDLAELQAYTQISFVTPTRPSLVTGVIDFRLGPATTDLWDSYREFLDPDEMGNTEFDLSAALFATGMLGDWLLTAAYNSEHALNERCDGNRLYRDVQACEQTYPVYGDSSTVDFLTPSIDSLYVRLERDSGIPNAPSDYFMWGDYGTREFAQFSQEFSAMTRQLHGFKGNYTLGDGLQLTAMLATNIRPFQRDTIVPDGTSGYYFLSRRLVLPGSEDIFIEVEELNRPGIVVDRVRLARNADYRIDYDRGSVLFTRPISAVDANPFGPALVRRIVATYQVDGAESGGTLLGARAQYNFSYDLDAPSWIGATLIREDQGAQDFSLLGVDALISLGNTGQLIAELARSSLDTTVGSSDGLAYRVEATGQISPSIAGTAYFRATEGGFRNNASSSFQPGQTRWGGQLGVNLGENTQLQFQIDREDNDGPVTDLVANPAAITLDTLLNPGLQRPAVGGVLDNSLTTIRAGLQQQIGALTANLDWTYRDRDDNITGTNFSSNQLGAGLTWPLASNLTFRAQTDVTLGGDDDPIYPGQTAFGIDWDVIPDLVTLRLAQRFFHNTSIAPDSLTTLDTLINYDLTDNTTLRGRYSLLGGYNGMTGQGSVGLDHRIVLAPGLHVDLGFERVFGSRLSLLNTGGAGQLAQPYAVGQTAAALGLLDGTTYRVGIEYTDNPAFQASARFEHRDSDSSGSNTVITASAAGRITPSLTTLARFEYGNFSNQVITGLLGNTSSIKLGLAYRNPSNDRFNGLLSYEYAVNPASTPNSILLGAGSNSIREHTLALEGIYAPNWQWEFYGKYALRAVDADLTSLGLGVNNTLHLAQLRAAYRFAYRWDVVGEVRYISQPSASFSELGWALEAGYYVTPDLRLGVGYSFGSADDRSFLGSGYRSDEGIYLAVTFKVNELLDQFGLQQFDRQPVAPEQQEESLVEASVDAGAAAALVNEE